MFEKIQDDAKRVTIRGLIWIQLRKIISATSCEADFSSAILLNSAFFRERRRMELLMGAYTRMGIMVLCFA